MVLQSLVQGHTESSCEWFAGWEVVSSPSEAEAGSKWRPYREAARSCPLSERTHLPGGWDYFNSLLKKKIAGGKFAKICMKCDFSHTEVGLPEQNTYAPVEPALAGLEVSSRASPHHRDSTGFNIPCVRSEIHVAKTPSGAATLGHCILERKLLGLISRHEKKPNWGA